MKPEVLYRFTYGLYLLTTSLDGKDNGSVINTAIQVAEKPNRVAISVINTTFTCELIKKSELFNLSSLTKSTPFKFFQDFGMKSGRDTNKFENLEGFKRADNGILYLNNHANMYISAKVVEQHDLGSHTLFIGEILDGEVLSSEESCTYGYYQTSIKPKPVSTNSNTKKWVCSVCGYVYEGDEVPDDYLCPLCNHDKDAFELLQETNGLEKEEGEKKMKFVCPVCGYVYEGDEIPAGFECPTCKCPGEKFTEMVEGAELAAEHKFGIGTELNGVPEEDKKYILDQLKANFNGECSEVGMYLCMARVAHREGYPEIGLYWEKAALEEAEHAAKFAELLGSYLEPNMTDSTKKNLAWRVECEFGATAGKTELAKVAKKYNLDAIHDTVHEMARDEARHGKALKGLLERYFK